MNKLLAIFGITAISLCLNSDVVKAQIIKQEENESSNISTSAASLLIPSPNSSTSEIIFNQDIAQTDIELGRLTDRHDYSYIGVGINIGLSGDDDDDDNDNGDSSTIGDTGLAITSKIALTKNISFRPGAVFADNTAILVPFTYDFTLPQGDSYEPSDLVPYLGAGAIFSLGDDEEVGFLITGGLDVRLSKDFVVNAGVNVGLMDETEVGLVFSVGYIFPQSNK